MCDHRQEDGKRGAPRGAHAERQRLQVQATASPAAIANAELLFSQPHAQPYRRGFNRGPSHTHPVSEGATYQNFPDVSIPLCE